MNRLLAYGVGLAAVIALILGYGHVRYKAGENAAETRMALAVKKANEKAAETEKTAQARIDLLEKDNVQKIADLDARLAAALARAPVIRVQKCTDRSELPKAPTDAGQRDDHPDGGGPAPENGDISPDLLLYAHHAERLRLALKTCQNYALEIDRFRASFDEPQPKAVQAGRAGQPSPPR